MCQRRPLYQRLLGFQEPGMQGLQKDQLSQGGLHARALEARPIQAKEQKALAVQEDSDIMTWVEDNFEKVNYVSPARDWGTEAPLLKMWLSQNDKSLAKVKGTPDTRCTTSLIRNNIVNRNKIIIKELVRPTLKVADGKRVPVQGTTKFTCLTSSGKRADVGVIATTAIDEEMLTSFKDLETLKHIPVGFPNTVVEQFDCYEKAKAISAGTLPLEEEFRDIIGDELNQNEWTVHKWKSNSSRG